MCPLSVLKLWICPAQSAQYCLSHWTHDTVATMTRGALQFSHGRSAAVGRPGWSPRGVPGPRPQSEESRDGGISSSSSTGLPASRELSQPIVQPAAAPHCTARRNTSQPSARLVPLRDALTPLPARPPPLAPRVLPL